MTTSKRMAYHLSTHQATKWFALLALPLVSLVTAMVLLTVHEFSNNVKLSTVQQPPTASQVANFLKCVNYKDEGPAAGGAVLDHGTCFIGKRQYVIDTFANHSVRDQWLKIAGQLGAVPKWENEYAVVCPKVDIKMLV